jgi:enterochelin esterase-like enzyme
MGLTSGSFVTLMIAVAAAGLLGVVWLWPRVAGRRVRDFAGRLGLVAVSQVLVIAAALFAINGYFSFYGSWSALLGSGVPRRLSAAAAAASSRRPIVITGTDLGPVPGGSSALPENSRGKLVAKPPHYYLKHHKVTALPVAPGLYLKGGTARAAQSVGEVLQVTIRGERTGITAANDYVYLPPQYFQPAYARARFPVVLALSGYPNDPWSIVKFLKLPATASRLVAHKRITPAVYVMMNVSVSMPRDTECTNIPAGLQVESFFAQDVPLAVEKTFRVQTGRSGWAVLGYSTGGYCAAKLAMMNPYQFSSAVSMAGYYVALRDSTTGNLYGGSLAYRNENNLDWRLTHLPAPPVSVLVTSSLIGERDLGGTKAFLRLIRPPMRGYALFLPQGGHNYRTWVRELPQSLEWLSRRLVPASPRSRSGEPALSRT